MRIFVTGASGWIGSALVPELLQAGHEVVGLARSDEAAARIEAAGGEVRHGSVEDLDVLAGAAADSDGVVHLAFQHEIAFGAGDFATAAGNDRLAVEVMGAALVGSGRPLVLASGVAGLRGAAGAATESDGLVPDAAVRALPVVKRHYTALFALSLAGRDVRSSVLRLAPTVHGAGDGGFVATYVEVARQRGVSAYVGDGANRWPAVHRTDAARLARLAVESAPAGSVLHAVADEGVAFVDIARAIGRGLDVPVESVAPAAALDHFGPLGRFASLDMPASSAATRALLGWEPTGPSLIEDLDEGHYFEEHTVTAG